MRMTRLLPTLLLLAAMTTVTATAQNVIRVSEGVNKIDDAVFEAEAGDIIELTTNGGLYREEISVMIDKDRKSTRLNSSHVAISYAVFCLKKKRNQSHQTVRH